MKKNYLLFLASFLLAVLFLAFSTKNKSTMEMVVGQEPYLPDIPLNYCIQLPEYLVNEVFWVEQNQSYLSTCISDDKATLGRVLFYDKRLSENYTRSCASCHHQQFGFADDQRFSSGIFAQQTKRNVPSINDLAWKISYQPLQTPLFWDGREDNLGEMVLQPIVHPAELGMNMAGVTQRLEDEQFYRKLFKDAYGTGEVTAERISESLKQFILTMVTFDSKYDRVHEGEMEFTQDEMKGEQLFLANCASCHKAPWFSVSTPQRNFFSSDTLDLGVGAITGLWADRWKFKAPSLRNIAMTAPYMHNGRMPTLEKVIQFYADSVWLWGVPNPDINLDATEVNQMVAFLNTLTSTNLLTNPKWSDPFVEPLAVNFQDKSKEVRIYPNPFTTSALVEFSNPTGKTVEISLHSLDGKQMQSFQTKAEKATIENTKLSPGIYLLELIMDDTKTTQRIVIQ